MCCFQPSSYVTCLPPSASVRSSNYRFSLTLPPHCLPCSLCFASAPERRFIAAIVSIAVLSPAANRIPDDPEMRGRASCGAALTVLRPSR